MNVEHYKLYKDVEFLHFEFFSDGPNGKIRKIIQYQEFSPGSQIYNLGFGDWNEMRNDVDDTIVTNNRDTQKVLGTVAKSVEEFMRLRPNATIFAQGSTLVRTRLYQMGVAMFLDEISEQFLVLGLIDKEWLLFVKGVNYEAFLLRKK